MVDTGAEEALALDVDNNLDDYRTSICPLPHCCFYAAVGPTLLLFSKAKSTNNQHDSVYMALLRSQAGDERFLIPARMIGSKKGQEPGAVTAQQLLKALSAVCPKYEKVNFRLLSESVGSASAKLLLELEDSFLRKEYTIGVIYAKRGQASLMEMLSNSVASPEFESFLSCLGDSVVLNAFPRFHGGLDTKYDSTGLSSFYTRVHNCEVMFHVSTLLPVDVDDDAQMQRSRFLRQDACLIVFQDEDSAPLSPEIFSTSKWTAHVVAVVRPVKVRSSNKARFPMDPQKTFSGRTDSFELKRKAQQVFYQVALAGMVTHTHTHTRTHTHTHCSFCLEHTV
jgi:hypothetical protein